MVRDLSDVSLPRASSPLQAYLRLLHCPSVSHRSLGDLIVHTSTVTARHGQAPRKKGQQGRFCFAVASLHSNLSRGVRKALQQLKGLGNALTVIKAALESLRCMLVATVRLESLRFLKGLLSTAECALQDGGCVA